MVQVPAPHLLLRLSAWACGDPSMIAAVARGGLFMVYLRELPLSGLVPHQGGLRACLLYLRLSRSLPRSVHVVVGAPIW